MAVLALWLCGAVESAAQGRPAAGPTFDTLKLTITDARVRALSQNPELAATRVEIDIAQGSLRQASTIRFNPSLDALGAGTSGSTAEISVGQEIEIAGQRDFRRRAARAQVERVRLTISDAARLLIANVDRGFYRVFTATRRVELSQEVLALNLRLNDVAQRQLFEGEVSKLEYNLAVIELGRSRSRVVAAERDRETALLELRRLLGVSQQAVIATLVDSAHRHVRLDSTGTLARSDDPLSVLGASLADLTSRALARRPDLRASAAAVERTTAEATLAEREAFPNLLARVAMTDVGGGGRSAVRPGIGLSLPIFNRNRGEIDARRSAARQAELEQSSFAQRIRADVEFAVRAYMAAATEVEILESTVLVPARENRQLLEAAYREGKVGLSVLLLIRNQVIDAEQEYWSAWLAEREALAALGAATGENIDSFNSRSTHE